MAQILNRDAPSWGDPVVSSDDEDEDEAQAKPAEKTVPTATTTTAATEKPKVRKYFCGL